MCGHPRSFYLIAAMTSIVAIDITIYSYTTKNRRIRRQHHSKRKVAWTLTFITFCKIELKAICDHPTLRTPWGKWGDLLTPTCRSTRTPPSRVMPANTSALRYFLFVHIKYFYFMWTCAFWRYKSRCPGIIISGGIYSHLHVGPIIHPHLELCLQKRLRYAIFCLFT